MQRDYPVWRDSTHFTTSLAEDLDPLVDNKLAQRGVFDGTPSTD